MVRRPREGGRGQSEGRKNNELKSAESTLAKGADVNFPDDVENEHTPLHVAAMLGSLQIIVLLHSQGAAIGAKNSMDRTPLETAQKVGEDAAATVLEDMAAERPVDLSKLGDDDDDDEGWRRASWRQRCRRGGGQGGRRRREHQWE